MGGVKRVTEAEVERDVLLALGRAPGVLILKNEVGSGLTGNVVHAVLQALEPFGHLAQEAARSAMARHHIVYGLGKGSPDLVGVVDGRAVGLELKAPDGTLQPHQATWHVAARRRGMFVAVVRSADEAIEAVARSRRGENE
jgi:hypothetical protein